MGKAVFVLDEMPRKCRECVLSEAYMCKNNEHLNSPFCFAKNKKMKAFPVGKRPYGCPLKEMSEVIKNNQ